MIDLATARRELLAACARLEPEQVDMSEALGRRLGAPVVARFPYPNADVSAMDGYAFAASCASRAGAPWEAVVRPGEAVRIFTGAIVPSGADCVALQEDALRDGHRVEFTEIPRPRQHIRFAGEGHQPGDRLMEVGDLMGPAAVGLLVGDGHRSVNVVRRPRVAILGTGDELLDPGGQPQVPGTVVDGNGPMIATFVRMAGGEVLEVSRARESRSLQPLDAREA